MKIKKKLDRIFWILFIGIFILGIIGFIWMVVEENYNKEKICRENNGVTKNGFMRQDNCINESGVYEIVKLNGEWRLIK